MRLFTQFILRPLAGDKIRTATTVLGVALGIAVVIAIQLTNASSVRGFETALETVAGKTAVEVPDSTGFVVNRLLFPYLFDAVRLLEREGLEPDAVDSCMKLGAGHPMGPLALLDFVGLDVAAAIGESLGVEVPERVRALLAEGKLGKKSGAGFYAYS